MRGIGIPDEYVEHGNVEVLRREVGLDAARIVKQIITDYASIIEESSEKKDQKRKKSV